MFRNDDSDMISKVHTFIRVDSILLVLIVLNLLAGTYTYMFSRAEVHNNISIGYNDSVISEVFGEYDKFEEGKSYVKEVTVSNEGNVDCYVRVFAEIEEPKGRKSVEINYDNTNWEKQSDGYYYYKKILKVGEKTKPLFDKITAKEEVTDFAMICYEETVQSEGFETPEEAFDALL